MSTVTVPRPARGAAQRRRTRRGNKRTKNTAATTDRNGLTPEERYRRVVRQVEHTERARRLVPLVRAADEAHREQAAVRAAARAASARRDPGSLGGAPGRRPEADLVRAGIVPADVADRDIDWWRD